MIMLKYLFRFQRCRYRLYEAELSQEPLREHPLGMKPRAASKQAPEIRPCSRSSGLGASPNLPPGSEPITLKYLQSNKKRLKKMLNEPNLKIMTAMSEFLEKSKIMSSAIFLAFP
ncbi:hypothetical protein IGI04_025228 [Brassica rapa subsp. trilocularis]|uniref:Uncharacterized protein n=1 Tax=Brassica rapa subsp. trilocularis TaxID=1813537 RepID=A0ABQ7M901_BRACM|nr:hypothetical protein IGI04_025228 [Brassica rapa subsp. trilocularis]